MTPPHSKEINNAREAVRLLNLIGSEDIGRYSIQFNSDLATKLTGPPRTTERGLQTSLRRLRSSALLGTDLCLLDQANIKPLNLRRVNRYLFSGYRAEQALLPKKSFCPPQRDNAYD